jgi:HEAT repeat protein
MSILKKLFGRSGGINSRSEVSGKSVQKQVKTFRSRDEPERIQAAEALGDSRDSHAVEILIAALTDSSPSVVKQAAKSLGKIGDERAILPLVAVVESNWSLEASIALKTILSKSSREALISMLDSSERCLRQSAVGLLAKREGRNALELLIPMLGDKESSVRIAAVDSLKRLNDPAVVEALVGVLKDEERSVQIATVEALGAMKSKLAVPHLVEAFHSGEDVKFRIGAAASLKQIGDPVVIKVLTDAFQDKDTQMCQMSLGLMWELLTLPTLAQQAKEALLEYYLAALAESDGVKRAEAVKALSRLADRSAIQPLIKTLKDETCEVRLAAVEALEHLKSILGGMEIRRTLDEYAKMDYWSEDIAEKITAMYRKSPDGFYRGFGSPEEKKLREIGQILYEKGGMDMMLQIHEQFSARCNIPGAARNLEILWDGIGNWKG